MIGPVIKIQYQAYKKNSTDTQIGGECSPVSLHLSNHMFHMTQIERMICSAPTELEAAFIEQVLLRNGYTTSKERNISRATLSDYLR